MSTGCQSHGIAKESEIEVGSGIELQLSGILSDEPRLEHSTVVKRMPLRSYELPTNAQCMLIVRAES